MGRTLKRVALDFDWPLKERWPGFLNPYQAAECIECRGMGYSKDARVLYKQWYGNAPFVAETYGAEPLQPDHPHIEALAKRNTDPATSGGWYLTFEQERERLFEHFRNQWLHHLIQADVDALVAGTRLQEFTHVPRNEEQREIVKQKIAAGGNSWLPEPNGYTPTAKEVNDWSLYGFGHDAINCYVCVKARCAREGIQYECLACAGQGGLFSDEDRQAEEDWKEEEPPAGPGYQLWETTSEGSPSSPVFETLDELCAWCEPNASTFGYSKTTKEKWREMLDEGFVYHQEGNNTFI